MLTSLLAGYFRIEYGNFLEIQNRMISLRQAGKLGNSILYVHHDHVFTGGIRSSQNDVTDKTVKLIRVNRGGSVTYHGPGQVNVYPVINIEEEGLILKSYMEILQKSVSFTLTSYGINSENRLGDHLGTWVNGRKICSYGVAVQKGVTSHGLSLNVTTDMSFFGKIRPCGFEPAVMVSMGELLPQPPNPEEVSRVLVARLMEYLHIINYIKIESVEELDQKIQKLMNDGL